jgi:hypothetical protein
MSPKPYRAYGSPQLANLERGLLYYGARKHHGRMKGLL